MVHIGGGEPLLSLEHLVNVLHAAQRIGIGIEYVETNSAWYVDLGQAEETLTQLMDAGVSTLLVSISPFHNAHIPFSRVRGVIDACHRTGMHVFAWVDDFVRDLERLGDARPHAMEEFEEAFGADYLARIPDRYWIHLGGRALDTFRAVHATYPAEMILERSPRNCTRALSDTTHFHIDLYGNYIPGLCAGLAVDMNDLGRMSSEGKYPLIDRLAAGGIRGLFEMAAEEYGYVPKREDYLNHCDLCTDIRGFLLHTSGAQFAELAPGDFYGEMIPGEHSHCINCRQTPGEVQ
jgi:hypothetical protein